ncbi:MAG TPA: flagellar basal body P-ring formation chaperone FlgA [Pseudolabrys sp.]|jgi:flagella basal body P-ring formation protein FlgA
MIRLFLAAFLAWAAFVAPSNAQTTVQPDPGRPVLKAKAVIHGDIVRIGDLIENAGVVAAVPIFRAPDLGHTGTVSTDAVLNAIRDHALIGIDTAGLDEVVVTRASRPVPSADIEALIARALSARFNLGASKDIVVNLGQDTRTIYVEPSAVGEPRVTHIDYDARSARFDAMIEIPAASGKRSVLRFAGRATPMVEIATIGRTIERGTIIKAADVVMDRRPRAEVGRDIITRREDAAGLAARGTLQGGRPLRAADLMKPDLIQRNESVTLVYEAPGIVLTIRGRANEGGVEGDVISVLNEHSKRLVHGVIIGPGRVAVTSGSPRLAANTPAGSASTNAH